jgi:hypothetical protein
MYDPAMARFTTQDPMAEKYYSVSPYAYCNNNPVNYIDPTGMWIEDEEGFHTSSEDEIQRFVQQHRERQEKFSFNNISGFFKAMGNFLGTAFQGTFFDRQQTHNGQTYLAAKEMPSLPVPDLSVEAPDYMALTLSGNGIIGGGFGLDGNLGYIKDDGLFMNVSFRAGVGYDLGGSGGITIANYFGYGVPTASSLKGPSLYENVGGELLNFGVFQDLSYNRRLDKGLIGTR